MRGREAAVSAVSEPEKKPESAIRRPIAPMMMAVSVVMAVSLPVVVGGQRGRLAGRGGERLSSSRGGERLGRDPRG